MNHEANPWLPILKQELKIDEKLHWQTFYDASWELFNKGSKQLNWIKKQQFKKQLIKALPVQPFGFKRTELSLKSLETLIDYSKQVHTQEIMSKYPETLGQATSDAKIIMLTNQFFSLVSALGITEQRGAGGISNCFLALRNTLPWNRYGYNEVTIRKLPKEDVLIANEALAGIASQLHIQLDSINVYQTRLKKSGTETVHE